MSIEPKMERSALYSAILKDDSRCFACWEKEPDSIMSHWWGGVWVVSSRFVRRPTSWYQTVIVAPTECTQCSF